MTAYVRRRQPPNPPTSQQGFAQNPSHFPCQAPKEIDKIGNKHKIRVEMRRQERGKKGPNQKTKANARSLVLETTESQKIKLR